MTHAPMDPLDRCVTCNYCAQLHGRYRSPEHPCNPWTSPAQDPLNPPQYRWEKNPFRLFRILKSLLPKAKGGYKKETHWRPRFSRTKIARKRLSLPRPPWGWVRRGVERQVNLKTPSPRITTIAHHGPKSLARPFFPEWPDLPKITITEERALAILMAQRASRLAGNRNLSLGGYGTNIEELEALKSPEVSETMEETEPLRAMALKEVTNLMFLRDYTAVMTAEEPRGTEPRGTEPEPRDTEPKESEDTEYGP